MHLVYSPYGMKLSRNAELQQCESRGLKYTYGSLAHRGKHAAHQQGVTVCLERA